MLRLLKDLSRLTLMTVKTRFGSDDDVRTRQSSLHLAGVYTTYIHTPPARPWLQLSHTSLSARQLDCTQACFVDPSGASPYSAVDYSTITSSTFHLDIRPT